jgi:hypothetical protein
MPPSRKRKRGAAAPPIAAPPAKRPAHRPPYEATDKDRLTVKVMVAGGIEQDAIAGVLGISSVTLRKYFRREIATGAAEIGAQVVASLITLAVGQKAAPGRPALAANVQAAKWYTQARMGWQERVVVVDGGSEVDPATLSDSEIADRLAKLRRSPGLLRAAKATGTVH